MKRTHPIGGRAVWILLATAAGCQSTRVVPPATVERPTTVYLCDYGIHSSLLLPVDPDQRQYVEYVYGDWNWAALGNHGPLDALGAMLWSGQATLGRRFIDTSAADPVPHPPTTPKSQTRVVVDAARCAAVVAAAEARWMRHVDTAVGDGFYTYVHDDDAYGLRHDCNKQTADWLVLAGCKIVGSPVLPNFDVRPPTTRPTDGRRNGGDR